MEFDIANLTLQAGGGAVAGGVTGFAAKQVLKIIAVLIGLQIGLLAYLESRGLIAVNWDQLNQLAAVSGSNGSPADTILAPLLSVAPVSGGFAAGALVGFKKG